MKHQDSHHRASEDHHIFEGITHIAFEIGCPVNGLRIVISDTLPWQGREAIGFQTWSDEEILAYHMEALDRKIDDCMAVAASDAFRLRHPDTAIENVRIVVRFRNLPISRAKAFWRMTENRVKNEGMEFLSGYGGENM